MGSTTSDYASEFNASTHAECARFFRVSTKTIQTWIGEGCPGNRGDYPLDEMLLWAKANKWCKSSDPLLVGGDSDNLERYRGVKADLAEIDLQERREEMINLQVVKPAYIKSLGFMKAVGEKLDRRFGNEALEILLEGWNQAMEYITNEFGDDSEDGERN